MFKPIRGRVRGTQPNVVRIIGSFSPYLGDNERCYIALVVEGGLTNFDSILEASTGLERDLGADIYLETVDDITSAAATLDTAAAGCANLDTVISFATVGAGGNAWRFQAIDHGIAGGGEAIVEDVVNNTLTLLFEGGVSTVVLAEGVINGSINMTAAGGTPASVLTGVGDSLPLTPLTLGVDTVSILVSGIPGSRTVTIHFENSVTTVAEVENAIGALAGAADLIQVRTAGTAVNVLTAVADTLLRRKLSDWKAPNQVGRGWLAYRTATGEYVVRFDERFIGGYGGDGGILLGAAHGFLSMSAPVVGGANLQVPIKIHDPTVGGGGAFTDVNLTQANRIYFAVDLQK